MTTQESPKAEPPRMWPTRKDREAAWLAIGATLPAAHDYGERFLATGADPSDAYPITERIARAITTARQSAEGEPKT